MHAVITDTVCAAQQAFNCVLVVVAVVVVVVVVVVYLRTSQVAIKERKGKGKERKSNYIAPFRTKVHTKRSGMDHTVLPVDNAMPAFPS